VEIIFIFVKVDNSKHHITSDCSSALQGASLVLLPFIEIFGTSMGVSRSVGGNTCLGTST